MSEANTESTATANVLPRILYIQRIRPFQPQPRVRAFSLFSESRKRSNTLFAAFANAKPLRAFAGNALGAYD
ncbi:hypothetical protein NN6n1_29580 [Shinella zoogloeoides]